MMLQLIFDFSHLRHFTVYSSIGWLGEVRLGQHMIIYLLFAIFQEIIASEHK
jgi:hypothetical protein